MLRLLSCRAFRFVIPLDSQLFFGTNNTPQGKIPVHKQYWGIPCTNNTSNVHVVDISGPKLSNETDIHLYPKQTQQI